jgi:hypothetical protein
MININLFHNNIINFQRSINKVVTLINIVINFIFIVISLLNLNDIKNENNASIFIYNNAVGNMIEMISLFILLLKNNDIIASHSNKIILYFIMFIAFIANFAL